MVEDQKSFAEKVPVEIISNILRYLSTSDRKNARLVNFKWYQASREIVLQKTQKFVIDGPTHNNQLAIVLDVLENGGFQYYNLEFRNADFNSSLTEFLSFVKRNMLYIHSLTFKNCDFPFLMIEEIMINCINLENFRLQNCSCDASEKAVLIPNSEEEIVRRSLTYLEIKRCSWVTNEVFQIFISVYPNIKKLHSYYDAPYFTVNFEKTLENTNLSFLNLTSTNSIRTGFEGEFFEKVMDHSWINVEELRPYDAYYYFRQQDFEAFLLTQKDLKVFDSTWCERFDTECLELLLNRYPDLECLIHSIFWRYRDQSLVKRVLELVANSRLKVLAIDNFIFSKEDATFPKFHRNRNVHYLDLHNRAYQPRAMGNTFLETVLKTFCNLVYLDLSKTKITGSKKNAVKIIFQEQIQLKYLKLNNCHWISDHVFKKSYLTKLEHLELKNSRLTGNAFKNFHFPKLKFLCLEGCWAIPDEGFLTVSQKCPLLGHLNVSRTRISEKTIMNVCENLKFLHCVDIVMRNKTPPILDIDTILRYCPSLRFIRMGRFVKYYEEKSSISLYAYNYLGNEWIKCEENRQLKCFKCQPSKRQLMGLHLR